MIQAPTSDTKRNWFLLYHLNKNDLTESVYTALKIRSNHMSVFLSARAIVRDKKKNNPNLSRKMKDILLRKAMYSINSLFKSFKF